MSRSSKHGRNKNSPSHVRYISENHRMRNKMRNVYKNICPHPNRAEARKEEAEIASERWKKLYL